MRSWLVALRIARREARRSKGRTILIVAMICLPVFALAFAATTYDMQRLSPQEKATRMMGTADGIVYRNGQDRYREDETQAASPYGLSDGGSHPAATILPMLPAGSSATGVWTGSLTMRTAGGVGNIDAYGIDASSPITTGMIHVLRGRAPRTAGEVALSPSALTRLGSKVGQTVTTKAGAAYVVVGVAEVGGRVESSMLFAADPAQPEMSGYWLIRQPSSPLLIDQIHTMNDAGYLALSRAYFLHPPKQAAAGGETTVAGLSAFSVGTLVAGLGLLEVVLLAGPAFAVGARRRQRDLALVATNGGTPSVLRRIVLADGIVCGAIAAAVGLASGVAVAFAVRGLLETHLWHTRFVGYRVNPGWLAGIVAVAVVTGLLGALVPAFTAARQEIVLALAGRRGIARSRVRWVLVGIALILIGGIAATYGAYGRAANTVLAGLVAGEFGIVLCTPTIIGWIARLGRFLPLTPRIALRDASRRRAAAAPAISAVMAAVAGSIALTVYLGATDQGQSKYIASAPIGTVFVTNPGTPAPDGSIPAPTAAELTTTRSAVRTVFPAARTLTYATLDCASAEIDCTAGLVTPADRICPYEAEPSLSRAEQRRARADVRCMIPGIFANHASDQIVTDDPAVVSAVTGLTGTKLDAAVATLRRGGLLTSESWYVENGTAMLELGGLTPPSGDASASSAPPFVSRPMTVPAYVTPVGGASFNPILSPAIAASAHIRVVATGLIAILPSVPNQARQDQLQQAVGDLGAQAYVEQGDQSHPSPVPLILAIAAGIIALGAAGIATGLAAADSRHDLTTLAAVGATPRVRRSLSLAQSGIIAGLGALLGSIAGYGAAAAVLTGINQQWVNEWPGPALYRISVPWTNFGISLVLVPLVAMAAAGLLTRSRLPSERRAT